MEEMYTVRYVVACMLVAWTFGVATGVGFMLIRRVV